MRLALAVVRAPLGFQGFHLQEDHVRRLGDLASATPRGCGELPGTKWGAGGAIWCHPLAVPLGYFGIR